MTAKRFKKLLMSVGVRRNNAAYRAYLSRIAWGNYGEAWESILDDLACSIYMPRIHERQG